MDNLNPGGSGAGVGEVGELTERIDSAQSKELYWRNPHPGREKSRVAPEIALRCTNLT
jgi:hypothetical protein